MQRFAQAAQKRFVGGILYQRMTKPQHRAFTGTNFLQKPRVDHSAYPVLKLVRIALARRPYVSQLREFGAIWTAFGVDFGVP